MRGVAIGALLTLLASGARAQECVESPEDAEVTARLDWIEERVDDAEDDIRRWFTGFVAFHVVLVGSSLALAFAAPEDGGRIDFTTNAVSGALGLTTLLASFPPILGFGDALRALPRGTPQERLESLQLAEARLRRSAEASAFARSEVAGIASALYVEAASLTLLGLGRPIAATTHAIGGAIIGQGRLLLHPTGAIDAWRTYRARHPEAGCSFAAPAPAPVSILPSAGPGLGVGLRLLF